ncbi:DUF3613 domain-containing protein [Paraburkholderia sediminicola]|uniref:DUF3613 domain-containing protein n=1 Tax=Paraburkholderia sediminicola TaxID=458836 RepID=UPI0038B78256
MRPDVAWRGVIAVCIVAAAWCASGIARAQPAGHSAASGAADGASSLSGAGASVLASEIGHSTRDWLDLQRSGVAAAPPLRTLGEEAGLAYQRYMESFKRKIPASFSSSVNGNGNPQHDESVNTSEAPKY